MAERWRRYLTDRGKQFDPVFAAWLAFAKFPENEFTAKAGEVAAKVARTSLMAASSIRWWPGRSKATRRSRSLKRRTGIASYSQRSMPSGPRQSPTPSLKTNPHQPFLPMPTANKSARFCMATIRRLLCQATNSIARSRSPIAIRSARCGRRSKNSAPVPSRPRCRRWAWKMHPAFPRKRVCSSAAMPVGPVKKCHDSFYRCSRATKREPFKDGSGRLELARAIASADNPLTARVLVNRAWLHHFGQGLVRTPSDFGLRSDPPSHPELLDYLASRFVAEGWSIKKLHRWILLSSTYQQASGDRPEARAKDPENVLVWRMNRQRMDLEALRDSLLFVSGQLDETIGGPAVNIVTAPFSKRRSVYGQVERQNLPSFFRTFDFATPNAHSPQRFTTTVPQQALFLMNSPFVIDLAAATVRRPEIDSAAQPRSASNGSTRCCSVANQLPKRRLSVSNSSRPATMLNLIGSVTRRR